MMSVQESPREQMTKLHAKKMGDPLLIAMHPRHFQKDKGLVTAVTHAHVHSVKEPAQAISAK